MNELLARRPVPVESRRIPLEATVVLTQPETGFSREVAGVNLSMSGMFVSSAVLLDVGTLVDFRFDLGEDQQSIHGRAEVVWTREDAKGIRFPKGLGMRFLRLDAECRRRIRKAVESLIQESDAPPELRELRMVVEETLEDILSLESPAPVNPPALLNERTPHLASESRAMVARSELGSGRWLPIMGIGLLVLLVVSGSYFLARRGPQVRGSQVASQSASAVSDLPATKAPDLARQLEADQDELTELRGFGPDEALSVSTDKTVKAPPGREQESLVETGEAPGLALVPNSNGPKKIASHRVREEVQRVVMGWAKVWSDQEPERYLEYYSRRFVLPDGLSRSQWESQRRQRISQPQFVRVSLVDLEVAIQQEDLVQAHFLQNYRSDSFEDAVRKTLHLVREDDAWKISQELSGP
ncbi:MAG: PilZ domain-containing protein [Deltaproteobacteria bacterium]|nr:PilZ domain-containing protein [Deltaproteobacteria bacterium]